MSELKLRVLINGNFVKRCGSNLEVLTDDPNLLNINNRELMLFNMGEGDERPDISSLN
jgi:hypothetical protein